MRLVCLPLTASIHFSQIFIASSKEINLRERRDCRKSRRTSLEETAMVQMVVVVVVRMKVNYGGRVASRSL